MVKNLLTDPLDTNTREALIISFQLTILVNQSDQLGLAQSNPLN